LAWIVGSVLLLLILINIAIRIPAVQNFIVQKVISIVSESTGADIELDQVLIKFPKTVVLEGLFVEDLQNDTLLNMGKLEANVDIWGLLGKKIHIKHLGLYQAQANISRGTADTTFNFNFIIEAFASEGQTDSDTGDADPWEFSLGKLRLKQIKFQYFDSISGINVHSDVGNLNIEVNELRFDTLTFGIDEIALENATIQIRQYGQPIPDTGTSSVNLPEIKLNRIRLANINFDMSDAYSGFHLKTTTQNLLVKLEELDLQNQIVAIDKLDYSDADVRIEYESPPQKQKNQPSDDGNDLIPDLTWKISSNDLTLQHIAIELHNVYWPDTTSGFDPNHLSIDNFGLQARDVYYAGSNIKANIEQLAFTENHGFSVKKLTASVSVSDTTANVEDLLLKTVNSSMQLTAESSFSSLNDLTEHPEKAQLKVQMEINKLDTADMQYFVPGLLDSLPLKIKPLQTLTLKTKANGNLNHLDIRQFAMDVLDSTYLILEGTVSGFTDRENFAVDLPRFQLSTSRKELHQMFADTLFPDGINLPNHIEIEAVLKGRQDGFKADANIGTSFGKVLVKGSLAGMNTSMPEYEGSIRTNTFRLGALLNDTSAFGPLTFTIEAKGKGFELETMSANADIRVNSFNFQGYKYDSIVIDAGAESGKYTLAAEVKDAHVDFEMDGTLVYDAESSEIDLRAELNGINLQQLGIVSDDIRAKGKLEAHLTGNAIDNLNGHIDTRDILIIKNDELYPVDSLIFVSINDTVQTELSIESDFLSAFYQGTIKPDKLVASLKDHFSRYFLIGNDTVRTPGNENFDFEVHIKSSSLLTQVLVPGLEKLEPGQISGTFKESEQQLSVELELPVIDYKGYMLKNLKASIHSGKDQLDFSFAMNTLSAFGYFISDVGMQAQISEDKIDGKFRIEQNEQQSAYNIPFTIQQVDSSYLLSFSDELILNSNTWQLSDKQELDLNNLASGNYDIRLTSNEQSVQLTGTGQKFTASLDNFRLSNLGNILNTSDGTVLLQAKVNGDLVIEKGADFDSMSADFKFRDFNILENPLGNMKLSLQRDQPGFMSAELKVSGNNELTLKLDKIPLDTSNAIDGRLVINRFEMQTVNGFLPQASDSLKGYLKGELSVANTTLSPEFNGEITFLGVHTYLKSYGTYINADGQKLHVVKNNIEFPDFTLRGKNDGKLVLNGRIQNKKFSKYIFDVQLDATEFMAVDKPKKDQMFYHGQLVFSTSSDLKGTLDQMMVDGTISINSATDFSMNLLSAVPSRASYTGVVDFVDKDQSLNPILIDTTSDQLSFIGQGFIISSKVEIEEGARLEMVVDEKAGDKLWVKGSANLSFSMDETGLPTLSGRYNLTDGGYKLTLFDITQREFKLENSSYITWTGEPMEARLHIDASYQVNTSAYNLIIDQTANTSGEEVDKYRQRLPFTVNLMIRGEINSPIINFNIKLPPEKQGVYGGVVQSKLNELEAPGNESSLNKQVLSLLAFRQFMPQNPLDIGNGSAGLNTAARNSVSKVLSNQLNNFSDKYIKGFNLSFDVQSYEQYSQDGGMESRTELGVGVSKSFFSNRLQVSVGSSVELESEKYRSYNSFNDIAENIEVEYLLTENGVYRIKAFQLSDYDQFEGDITKSGISFIYNKDFNWIRNIFLKTDSVPERKLRKENENK